MADLNGFDANDYEPAGDFEPIPAGKQVAVITESEMKPTKAGTGTFLKLLLEILEGKFKGRKLWARLNLEHPNPTVVAIAKRELADICRAVDVLRPKSSTDLHNRPLVIRVKVVKRKDTGDLVNEIKGYSKVDSTPPAASSDDNTPPWKRS